MKMRGREREKRKMNEENEALYRQYIEEESLRGHTVQGFESMRRAVRKFFEYAERHRIKVYEAGAREALEYQGWLIATGRKDGKKYSTKTILLFLFAASSFYEFLKRKNMTATNPFKEIKKIRLDRSLPAGILKEKELDEFLDELKKWWEEKNGQNQITRYRVHVIAELQYASGLRIAEAAALKSEDIDFLRGIVRVRHGKGGRERLAFLSGYAADILKIYLERMRSLIFSELNDKNPDLLFGVKRQGLSEVVNATLNRIAKKLGHRGFTSHKLRHALGYHLLRAGCGIRHIREILGHKCLRSTEVYTKVDKEELKKVLDTYHPRQWKRSRGNETDRAGSE
jgi:integrase/recombinase XerD